MGRLLLVGLPLTIGPGWVLGHVVFPGMPPLMLLLLSDDAPARVRVCPGPGCGWVFLDTSGRRRWCTVQWCGNRAKVRAHAQRRRAHPPA